jgi:hypothetical protein
MEHTNRIVEINGVKMELDLREARTVDTFKVGDKVKLLKKEYSSYKSYPGMIIGFDQFKALPTIIVAYVDTDYSGADIKFAYMNAETEGIEICLADRLDLPVSQENVISLFDRDIVKKRREIEELERKREYFVENFNKYFEMDGASEEGD